MPTERIRPNDVAPAGMKAVVNVEAYIQKCGLDHSLIELVNARVTDQRVRILPWDAQQ